jgi:hypothetical protein
MLIPQSRADSFTYPTGVPMATLESLLSEESPKNIEYIKRGYESCKSGIYQEYTTTTNEDWYNDESCNWLAYLGTSIDPHPGTLNATKIVFKFLYQTKLVGLQALQLVKDLNAKNHEAFEVIVYVSLINQNATPWTENFFQVGTFEVPTAALLVANKNQSKSIKNQTLRPKFITLICIKGTVSKTVRAIKPACPLGFKKK